MAAERKRRTSKLSSTHPAAPVEPAQESAAAPPRALPTHDGKPVQANADRHRDDEPAPEAATTKAAAAKDDAAPREKKPAKKWRHKVGVYMEPELTDRMRGAIMYTIPHEGTRTISEFINGLVERELERLEAEYNNGEPFPPLGPREVPQGRPMGR